MKFNRLFLAALAVLLLLCFCLMFACDAGEGDDDSPGDGDPGDDDASDDDDDRPPDVETTEGFACVPGGVFDMGSPTGEMGHRDNEALHEVSLRHAFEIKQTEVTQKEYIEFLGYNPSKHQGVRYELDQPVEQVSWYDALAFADRLSDKHGYPRCYALSEILCSDLTPGDEAGLCRNQGGIHFAQVELIDIESVYDCRGFRLPTEAEWERAARGGRSEATYNGDVCCPSCAAGDPALDPIAWYCANAMNKPHPVGQKEPNEYGLYDMLGNVAEWTWDAYENDNTAMQVDPAGPAWSNFRVVRGGAYRFYGPARQRSAYRTGHNPSYRIYLVGMRPVRTLPVEESSLHDPAPPVRQEPVSPLLPAELPDELPFEFTRPPRGEPLTQAEIDEFTAEITGFWADSQFFDWLLWVGHGMPGNGDDDPGYKIWWQGTTIYKQDGAITFTHHGNADNLMTRNPKLLINAIAGYLASGDETMARVIEQYCYGFSALFKGFEWTDQDPEPWIMPRSFFPEDHYYTEQGREAFVDYGPVKEYDYDWNGWTIPNPLNPYWEGVWVRTMRSKDDVEDIYRLAPMLMRAAEEAPDQSVRDAAARALADMQIFARDIVDTGYMIRTKDGQGNVFVPLMPLGMVNDLASFVLYDPLLPNAECTAELTSALIGYGEPLGNECGLGIGLIYELIAAYQHYFNARIIRMFHIAAVGNALMNGQNDIALELLEGLALRTDVIFAYGGGQQKSTQWDADLASYLVMSAATGLPLTADEARHVVQEYTLSVEHYNQWPYWDPWSPSVPDGSIPYEPSRTTAPDKDVVRITQMLNLIEYCYSPFRNPGGAELVNCEVVLDPAQWGGN